MVGCGAQQTRKARCGVNRRSREERQGRNVFEAWQLRASGNREWTHQVDVDGEAIFEETPREELEGDIGRLRRMRWKAA
jgi:hypothetical protein